MRLGLAMLLVALSAGVAPAQGEDAFVAAELARLPPDCSVPAHFVSDPSPLRRSARRVDADRRFRIVVLGSASAQGVGASSPAASWPMRLEVLMRERNPAMKFELTVKAKAYDTSRRMLARLDEVIAERPHLVIWETGTAEAVRGLDIEDYVNVLREGIDRLAETRTDIILVEPQFGRRSALLINYGPYLEAIRQAEAMRDLIIFPRYAIMRHWAKSDQIVVDNLPASMMTETADKVYDCLARLLDLQIAFGLRPQ
jgi:acyl-CoA thioesterase I